MDYVAVAEQFRQAFPKSGAPHLCRAPGRVNLIGEHTDYNGLPVLPAALAQEIVLAYAPNKSGTIRLRNDDARFPPVEFTNERQIARADMGNWSNYARAAFQTANDAWPVEKLPGLDAVVASDLPYAAGLSSSSALVVAIALAYLDVLGLTLDKEVPRAKLAEMLAAGEQFVGTASGGMDQAISLLGQEGHALKIDFYPLRAEPAPLFKSHRFMVCNSLVHAAKGAEAQARYNEGPALCRVVTALVERHLQENFGEEIRIARLGDLTQGHLCMTQREVAALLDEVVPKNKTSPRQIARRLKMPEAEVRAKYLAGIGEGDGGYPLASRGRHVRTEAARVEAARDALLADDPETFGELMLASHESCARDYNVSSPELDQLVEAAMASGAIGARLTGAGFGGCVVALVAANHVDAFVAGVEERYYRGARGIAMPEGAVIVATGGAGAGYRP